MAEPSHKILGLAALSEQLEKLRDEEQRVVHCHGVFDLLHPGHIRHLEVAAEQGDVLVVTVASDRIAGRGATRPVLGERLRAETLAALPCVDFVAINAADSAAEAIELLRPSVYVQGVCGSSYDAATLARLSEERAAAARVGAQLQLADESAFSSAHLHGERFEVLSPEANAYLRDLSERWSSDQVVSKLRELRGTRVLVVGDTILDEYHFCRPYGKASKSSAISAQYQRSESYAGGVLAVANHIAGFCEDVHLVTCLGEQASRREFIERHLKPNVRPRFFMRSDAPTTVKRRFVEGFLMTKFFEISFFNDTPLPPDTSVRMREYLGDVAGDYDLVLVADFGHGLMTPELVETVCARARFLALNTQLNSINMGYNLVTRYPRADYVSIDEGETRLASRDRFSPLPQLARQLAGRLDCAMFATTRGKDGALVWDRQHGFSSAPVLSREVVDTIGAGDAFLAITAPCAHAGFPPELVAFVGNAVGALAVRIVGNKESVGPEALFGYLRGLLGSQRAAG